MGGSLHGRRGTLKWDEIVMLVIRFAQHDSIEVNPRVSLKSAILFASADTELCVNSPAPQKPPESEGSFKTVHPNKKVPRGSGFQTDNSSRKLDFSVFLS